MLYHSTFTIKIFFLKMNKYTQYSKSLMWKEIHSWHIMKYVK